MGWWYDTQKNVPNPKWGGRAPPERQFHGLAEGVAGAFDVYMVGLVFCCMAFGVDFPHIDRPSVKLQVEQRLKMKMVDNYLSTFELGATLRTHPGPFVEAFRVTFGTEFGSALLRIVQVGSPRCVCGSQHRAVPLSLSPRSPLSLSLSHRRTGFLSLLLGLCRTCWRRTRRRGRSRKTRWTSWAAATCKRASCNRQLEEPSGRM